MRGYPPHRVAMRIPWTREQWPKGAANQAAGSATLANHFTALCLSFPVCITHDSWIVVRIPWDDVWKAVKIQDPQVSLWLTSMRRALCTPHLSGGGGLYRPSSVPSHEAHLCPFLPRSNPECPIQATSGRLPGLRKQTVPPPSVICPHPPLQGAALRGGCPSASTNQIWKRVCHGLDTFA